MKQLLKALTWKRALLLAAIGVALLVVDQSGLDPNSPPRTTLRWVFLAVGVMTPLVWDRLGPVGE